VVVLNGIQEIPRVPDETISVIQHAAVTIFTYQTSSPHFPLIPAVARMPNAAETVTAIGWINWEKFSIYRRQGEQLMDTYKLGNN
jgi:hypothetical protein